MPFEDQHLCYKCKNRPKDIDGTTIDPNSCPFAYALWIGAYNKENYHFCHTSTDPNDCNSGQYIDENGDSIMEQTDNGGGYWITKCKNFNPNTNGEILREMTDSELAAFLGTLTPTAQSRWYDWLTRESYTEVYDV